MKDIRIPPEIYVPIFSLMIAELMMFSGNISYGLGIHIINLLIITIMVIFRPCLELKMKNILYGIILIILLQMIDITTPHFYTIILDMLKYIIMIIPIYYVSRNLHISRELLEINPKSFFINFIAIFMILIIVAIFQYNIGQVSSEITDIGGELVAIYLIVSIIITLLVPYTIYWNKYASDIIGMMCNSLLPVFAVIVMSNIIYTI